MEHLVSGMPAGGNHSHEAMVRCHVVKPDNTDFLFLCSIVALPLPHDQMMQVFFNLVFVCYNIIAK